MLPRPCSERNFFRIGVAVCLREDEAAFYLTQQALAQQKPPLGICRGAQRLDVAAGGDARAGHRAPPGVPGRNEMGSRWAQGPSFRATAQVADGIIEAIEGPGFAVGVHWHLERMGKTDASALAIFTSLVLAAGGSRHGKTQIP